ncbi:MAG: LAGLIDADG family homing endonuclease [Nitrososphaerales archaeon]|nr:LAGLIDADG family homing endonuclease [Nitrososphaerales archaeon]
MLSQQPPLSAEQEDLLSLRRTSNLSIRNLDGEKRDELRLFLDQLHNSMGLSLNDIAKLVGNKTSGYTSWVCRQLGVSARPFEESRLKAIREKRRKYERKPFDGTDEDKAYLLGLRRGDLSASKPWRGVVRVSTSTTHPAMVKLFRSCLGPYGHVYQHSRYKEDTQTFEWNLSVILDDTFGFLLANPDEVLSWVQAEESTLFAFLAGLLDSDGSIVITRDNRGYVALFLDYYGSDKSLLEWVKLNLAGLGYVSSLRINKSEGYRTKKYGIIHRHDYWQLSVFGLERVQALLQRVRPSHPEKVQKAELASSVTKGLPYSRIQSQVQAIRSQIRQDVDQFVALARTEFLKTHPSRVG